MSMTEKRYRAKAKELFHEEGSVEIDDGAEVAGDGDGGAYVQAWVWVPDDEEAR